MGRLFAAIIAVCVVIGSGAASAQVATITYPADGSKTFDSRQSITWTSVAQAEKYYVYVGRSTGGSELHNSGELAPTVLSRQLTGLPTGEMLWLRLWTRTAGVWRYQDSTFGSFVAYLIDPATPTSAGQTINWTSIASADRYYVYVGTTPGGTDIVNSGELPRPGGGFVCCPIGHTVPSPPPGTTYYVRLWTRAGGVWRYSDGTVNPLTLAVLTSPATTLVTDLTTFRWTRVTGAQAYYLYVGTTRGASDVVNSQELQVTERAVTPSTLPRGQTLCVRLWTKLGGVWRFADSTLLILGARLYYPADGATAFHEPIGFQWRPVSGAEAYQVWIGTTPGGSDVYQGSETQHNYLHDVPLPTAQQLFVRLWTKWGSTWRHTDSQFSMLAAYIVSPAGSPNFARGSQQVFWQSITGAEAYYVYVGSTWGAFDLVNSGELQQTSYTVRANYPGSSIVVRLWTKLAGVWRYTDFIYDLS